MSRVTGDLRAVAQCIRATRLAYGAKPANPDDVLSSFVIQLDRALTARGYTNEDIDEFIACCGPSDRGVYENP